MILFGLALSLFGACDAEFSVARGELGPWRLGGLSVVQGQARAAVWSGLGPWHDEPTELTWWVDGEPIGQGHGVWVPDGEVLEVEAVAPSGDTFIGEVSIAVAPTITELSRQSIDLTGEALDLAHRRTVEGDVVASVVALEEATRVGLTVGREVETRWMSAQGTPLALDEVTADLLHEDVVFDDGEVEERTALAAGFGHHLALALDGSGGNTWIWVDTANGVEPPVWRHRGRLLPGEVAPGLVAGTLTADDTHGVVLDDTERVNDLDTQEPLDCAEGGVPFELFWVTEGRCLRDEVVGVRVVVEAW